MLFVVRCSYVSVVVCLRSVPFGIGCCLWIVGVVACCCVLLVFVSCVVVANVFFV